MMTNLFSIFDPATPALAASNWAAMFLFLLLTPLTYWLMNNRMSSLFIAMLKYIKNEFSPLIKGANFNLIVCLALFTLILMNNAPSLLPYIFASTSHMSVTLALSAPIWAGIMMYAVINNTQNLLAHFIPAGTPAPLMPLMVMIEITSNIIRPGTLAVRLAANMIAGHLLIVLLMSASMLIPLAALPVLMVPQVALAGLEVAVSFIQAYVFSVLTTLYMAESIS